MVVVAQPQDSEEQVALRKAESAETMASTDAWKELMGQLAGDEASCLLRLYDYLIHEQHPDREEVITLCLDWKAVRQQRTRMEEKVEQARQLKRVLKEEPFALEPFWSDRFHQ